MNTAMVRFVGLDVHKRVVQACIVDQTGKVVHHERFILCRRTLETFATKILRPTDRVALEATTNCWAVADVLRPCVARVVVSNPMATKAIAQAKVKTDKVDAHVLAQLLRCDFLPEVWQPDEATRRLRELTGRRSALVSQRTMMRNRIHSVLAMRLVQSPSRLFKTEGLEWLGTVELDDQARLLVDSDLRQLDFLQKEIDALDAELARRGHASDPVKLLMTLPGVDVATAGAVLAAARKLAWIGWRMVVTGEPYRYAHPRTTANKLARLRVKVTGVCRKSGPAKGQKPVVKLPNGSPTIKALAAVYQSENLPQPWPLPLGEQRTVRQAGCEEFVARIGQTHVVPRTKRAVTGSSSLLRSNGRGKH